MSTIQSGSESVRRERVSFFVGDTELVGVLRRPLAVDKAPALVFEGPLTSVKEQVTGNYADALARRGFVTLAFDHRHFGESGGEPRQFEHPARKVEDLQSALEFLAALPDVDAERLGGVGVCAGAGYLAGAVAANSRIVAWGTVAGFFHDAGQQKAWMGDKYAAALERAAEARQHYEATGESRMIPAVGEGDVAMPLREAFEYYGTSRGAVGHYKNEFALMSREHTLPWDAQHFAPEIAVPTLMIHSEAALGPALARRFFAALGGPKRELWVESKGQIDFYDEPAQIEPAADALAEHFRTSA